MKRRQRMIPLICSLCQIWGNVQICMIRKEEESSKYRPAFGDTYLSHFFCEDLNCMCSAQWEPAASHVLGWQLLRNVSSARWDTLQCLSSQKTFSNPQDILIILDPQEKHPFLVYYLWYSEIFWPGPSTWGHKKSIQNGKNSHRVTKLIKRRESLVLISRMPVSPWPFISCLAKRRQNQKTARLKADLVATWTETGPGLNLSWKRWASDPTHEPRLPNMATAPWEWTSRPQLEETKPIWPPWPSTLAALSGPASSNATAPCHMWFFTFKSFKIK